MDHDAITELLGRQHGVVSRRQVVANGGCDNDIERLIRRREWARVHPGVYVDHTGPLVWEQRAWAALLLCWPAALCDASALRAHRLRRPSGPTTDDDPIEVAIAAERRVVPVDGVVIQRIGAFTEQTQRHLDPPRMRLEHALLRVAARADTEDAAVAVIADACQQRRTTADRLVAVLRSIPRLRHRRLLYAILDDVASGAFSALERRYLTKVERPHGLPTGARQRRVRPGRSVGYRDVDYVRQRTVVELDGRLGHEDARDRWRDLDRDLDSAVAGDVTVRAGWGQVLDPCRLAVAVARILIARGWAGVPRACGPACPVVDLAQEGGSPAPGAGDPPS